MEEKLRKIIARLIEKADEKLKVANSLFKQRYYEDAISRAYYAMFLSTQALLLTKGLSAKTHSGLLNLLGQNFIKTGMIEENYYQMIAKSKDLRESGDYDVFFEATPEDTEMIVTNAKKFLDRIKEYLKPAMQK